MKEFVRCRTLEYWNKALAQATQKDTRRFAIPAGGGHLTVGVRGVLLGGPYPVAAAAAPTKTFP